jgi:hypothetical protein
LLTYSKQQDRITGSGAKPQEENGSWPKVLLRFVR